jgi:hypothetical protein
MGDSHFKSDIYGKDGTEVIRGFATISATTLMGTNMKITTASIPTLKSNAITATALTVNTAASPKLTGPAYIKCGTSYIFFGTKNTEATIVPNATRVTSTPKGSIYISSGAGTLWVFDADTTATTLISTH